MTDAEKYEYWFERWTYLLNMPHAEREAMTSANLSFSAALSLQDYCGLFGLVPGEMVSQAQYGGFLKSIQERRNLFVYEWAYTERQLKYAAWRKRKTDAGNAVAAIRYGKVEEFELNPEIYDEFTNEVKAAFLAAGFKRSAGRTWRRAGEQPANRWEYDGKLASAGAGI